MSLCINQEDFKLGGGREGEEGNIWGGVAEVDMPRCCTEPCKGKY